MFFWSYQLPHIFFYMLKCPLSLPTFSYGSVKLLSVFHMFKPVRYTRSSHLFSLVICLPVLCLPILIIVALLQNPGPSLPSYLEIAFGSVLLHPLYLPHSWFCLSLWWSTPFSSFMKKVLFSLHTWCLVYLGKEFQVNMFHSHLQYFGVGPHYLPDSCVQLLRSLKLLFATWPLLLSASFEDLVFPPNVKNFHDRNIFFFFFSYCAGDSVGLRFMSFGSERHSCITSLRNYFSSPPFLFFWDSY